MYKTSFFRSSQGLRIKAKTIPYNSFHKPSVSREELQYLEILQVSEWHKCTYLVQCVTESLWLIPVKLRTVSGPCRNRLVKRSFLRHESFPTNSGEDLPFLTCSCGATGCRPGPGKAASLEVKMHPLSCPSALMPLEPQDSPEAAQTRPSDGFKRKGAKEINIHINSGSCSDLPAAGLLLMWQEIQSSWTHLCVFVERVPKTVNNKQISIGRILPLGQTKFPSPSIICTFAEPEKFLALSTGLREWQPLFVSEGICGRTLNTVLYSFGFWCLCLGGLVKVGCKSLDGGSHEDDTDREAVLDGFVLTVT